MILGALLLSPCVRESTARRAPATALPPATDSGAARATDPDAMALSAEPIAVPTTLTSVIEAVRHENWFAAHTAWLALPDAVRNSREARYLGGRIAIAQHDDARAVTFLHGLGRDIPALASDIGRTEGNALARLGRHAEARALFEQLFTRSHAERDRARAAEEAQALGDLPAAATVMRTWAADPPSGIDRARAWRHAAQGLEATGDRDGAARAWIRLWVDEPDASGADEARTALTRLGITLENSQVLSRATHLNERARYAQTIEDLSPAMPMAGVNEARRLHLLGRAYFYARNRYADATATLRIAAARPENPDRDEDAFLAARSLSRADHDDEAVAAYDEVARTVHGRWSDEAAFRAAWLVAHHDRIDDAANRFRTFVQTRTDAQPQMRSEAAWEWGWMLFQAGRFADAIPVLEQSSALATRGLERMRGRYWSAMARVRRGDREGAIRVWQSIRADRPLTWYALLAEARMRELVPPGPAITAPVEPQERRAVPPLALPENVRWLRALGFEREAGTLLAAQDDAIRARLPADRADEILAINYLEMGEPRRAYNLAQRHNDLLDHEPTAATRWAWDVSYPRPWAYWVQAAEDANHLPRHYLYAIMRQESAFDPRDVSNARAMGLLQMIPPTTRRVAQELHIEFVEDQLYDPEYNIRVGGHYIGRLFTQYRGVLPRAIGAFNGGPGAMSRWVGRWAALEIDAFVERIPYDETRGYVRRVIQNLARYRYLYGARGDEWPMRLALRPDPAIDTLVDY